MTPEEIAKQMVRCSDWTGCWALFKHDGGTVPGSWCLAVFVNEAQALLAREAIVSLIVAEREGKNCKE